MDLLGGVRDGGERVAQQAMPRSAFAPARSNSSSSSGSGAARGASPCTVGPRRPRPGAFTTRAHLAARARANCGMIARGCGGAVTGARCASLESAGKRADYGAPRWSACSTPTAASSRCSSNGSMRRRAAPRDAGAAVPRRPRRTAVVRARRRSGRARTVCVELPRDDLRADAEPRAGRLHGARGRRAAVARAAARRRRLAGQAVPSRGGRRAAGGRRATARAGPLARPSRGRSRSAGCPSGPTASRPTSATSVPT